MDQGADSEPEIYSEILAPVTLISIRLAHRLFDGFPAINEGVIHVP